jgi:hypothetical protein
MAVSIRRGLGARSSAGVGDSFSGRSSRVHWFIAGLLATASEELGISRSLVYRLVAKFRERPQVSSLLPGKRGRKPTSRTLPMAAEVVVQEAIDHFYLQREKPRLSDLLKEVEQECLRKGLGVPNYRTVKRRVDAIDARESVRSVAARKRRMIASGPLAFCRALICFL